MIHIGNDLLIEIEIDKEPYVKQLTTDRIINVTGESGCGKTHFCKKYQDDEKYVVVDTDNVFANGPCTNSVQELRNIFRGETKEILFQDFDSFYNRVLDYYKNDPRILVIDSAQFRNIQRISTIRGTVVVLRTSVNKCYEQCRKRYSENNPNATRNQLSQYAEKKMGIYRWYLALNDFLTRLDLFCPEITDIFQTPIFTD